MTYSFQNLQDFVLNLLNDDAARSAYAADPTGALADAGLGDLTPQDVQEVIPLVTDALPSETPLGDFAVDATGVMDGTDSLGGSLGVVNDLGAMKAWAGEGELGVWGGTATDALGRLAGSVTMGDNGVSVAAVSPLGYGDVDSTGEYHLSPADPADVADQLSDTGDAVAGTVTHMANMGALTLADGLDTGGDHFEGLLGATPAGPLAHGVESVTDMVSEDVIDGAGLMAEQAGNLPSTDALPSLPAVPQGPEVPGLGSLPALNDLPDLGDLPANLPVDAPSLPVDVPDTSAVTNVLQHNPVTDAVGSSPVGGLTDQVHHVTDHLPVGDVADDLNLGL
ncbi:MAG TPA: IniB N-terminal domain-containing protein [Actinophytocola sp.]|uniref:IniB N-terminal domain-containing protein n=1 Tax=Actinophytocola sp. TaxID=1872138 RepID=UPI002F94B1C9